jgi:hypothetical protein
MGRKVDLVDDEEIGPDDAGAALGRNLVAGGNASFLTRKAASSSV